MNYFECIICNYKTIRKNDFNKHLNTKKHKINENKKEVKSEKIAPTPHKSTQIHTNSGPAPHKSTQIHTKLVQNLTCEFCGKKFKRSDSLFRHTQKYCKLNKMKQKEKMLIQQLEKNEKEHKEEKQKLYDYIDKLIDKTGNTYNIEQQNNQINLNNFGHEYISHLTDKFMSKIISIPYVGINRKSTF
jgi:hypothetical protein